MESSGILADAEKVLSKKEASDFAERFSNILKNVKYSDTEAINTGIWKIKAVFYNSTDEMRIYVDEARIYLERNGKLITYDVPDSVKNDYDALYSEINELLES